MKKNIFQKLVLACLPLGLLSNISCEKDIHAATENTVSLSKDATSQQAVSSDSSEIFIAYFVTDGRNPTYKLTDIPEGVDQVVLFVLKYYQLADTLRYPASGGYTGAYSSYGALFEDVRTLQARGIKVVQNIDDEASWQTTTPAGFSNADAYAQKIKEVVLDTYHLDGISLDIEHSGERPNPIPPFPPYNEIGYYNWYSASMAANDNFINTIRSLTQFFGTTAPNAPILTTASGLDCYSWNAVASNFVNEFTYFTVQSYSFNATRAQLAHNYATGTNLIPSEKMVYGGNAETASTEAAITSMATWTPTQGRKGGVFVYAFNGNPTYGTNVLNALKGTTATAN